MEVFGNHCFINSTECQTLPERTSSEGMAPVFRVSGLVKEPNPTPLLILNHICNIRQHEHRLKNKRDCKEGRTLQAQMIQDGIGKRVTSRFRLEMTDRT